MPAQYLGDLSLNGYATAPSGSVRFYQPGTLVPVTVWSNDAATTAITQPVQLDALGKSTVPVYLTAPARMIVQSSSGATLLDIERVDGLRAETTALVNTSWPAETNVNALATALATSLGGKDGNVAISGTGAASRLLQAKLSEQVSVKDFGAVGNGIADDTAAFTAAFTFAKVVGGAVVNIPAGIYIISSAISILGDGISLKGSGGKSSVLRNSSASANLLNINGNRLFVEDVGFDVVSGSSGFAIQLGNSQQQGIALSRLIIQGHGGAIADGGALSGNSRVFIRDCELVGVPTGPYVIKFNGGPSFVHISGCAILGANAGSGTGISFDGGGAGCSVMATVVAGVATGFSIGSIVGCSLIGNIIESGVTTAIAMTSASSTDVTLVGNAIDASTIACVDSTTGQYNTYAVPRSGRWTAGYNATSTTTAITGAYSVINGQYNQHHVKATGAGTTVTISNPSVTPVTPGATISFFLENQSGGAVTWTFAANYRVATVNPSTGSGIGLIVAYNSSLAKWVEISRGTAA